MRKTQLFGLATLIAALAVLSTGMGRVSAHDKDNKDHKGHAGKHDMPPQTRRDTKSAATAAQSRSRAAHRS